MLQAKGEKIVKKILTYSILSAFLVNSFGPTPLVQAQDYRLPMPGVMVRLSPEFNPPILKGIRVHPDNPFRFDFILDKGDGKLSNEALKDESNKLIKYFLASLTIPEKDLWVNLSPYEKDRIIPNSFGLTEMGRDLLAEDYMLKQITASLIYPEDEIGKKFWKRIYEEAIKRYGTTNIPVNTFNKVWIVPEKAVIFENMKVATAYVLESKLKVMLEQDYLSLEKHEGIQSSQAQIKKTNQLGSQIVREVVTPELTTEINENKNFSHLRQVYNSLILATWYKKKIKDSILEQVYANKNKIAGVSIDDPQEKEKIYQRYLRAFKKGVYNYIKEDIDPITQETIPRKYFSGGEELIQIPEEDRTDTAAIAGINVDNAMEVDASLNTMGNVAMNGTSEQVQKRILRLTAGAVAGAANAISKVHGYVYAARRTMRRALKDKILIYDRDTKSLSIKDSKSHKESQIGLLGRGLNCDIFDLGDSVVRIVRNEHSYTQLQFQIIQSLGEIGASPQVLETGRTQEGNLYLRIEKIKGKVAGKLISESPPLNKKELDMIKNLLNLLIDHHILVDFNVENIMLGYVANNPSTFRAYLVDIDNVKNSVSTQASLEYYEELIGLWERIDPTGELAHFLQERLGQMTDAASISAEKDDAMLIKSAMSRVIASSLGHFGLYTLENTGYALTGGHQTAMVVVGLDVIKSFIGDLPIVLESALGGVSLSTLQGGDPRSALFNFGIFLAIGVSKKKILDKTGVNLDFFSQFMKKLVARNKTLTSPDKALNGGIDLTPTNNILQTKDTGEGIKFHLDQSQLAQLQNAPGFTVGSITIKTLKSLPVFLGLTQSQMNSQLTTA